MTTTCPYTSEDELYLNNSCCNYELEWNNGCEQFSYFGETNVIDESIGAAEQENVCQNKECIQSFLNDYVTSFGYEGCPNAIEDFSITATDTLIIMRDCKWKLFGRNDGFNDILGIFIFLI